MAIYAVLLVLPVLTPMPTRLSHIWSNLVLFAQFVFWGIWWPFVLISMVIVGRSWCGLFCPEGTLAEAASRHGLGRAIPRWIQWKGWPFVAFSCTTVYGQMISVYQYPKPVVIVLGGSTLAAMAVGFVYGRDKRVWCRYLCPVNGVFSLLAKLAPLHYRVDTQSWNEWSSPQDQPAPYVNCAPLVPIRTMQGSSACHMCGRCAAFKQSVALEPRSPSHEIINVAGNVPKPWETLLIIFGLMGLAAGAFQWSSSPLYVTARQIIAGWLIDHGGIAFIKPGLPWWILTNYPNLNDMMTPLDGGLMIAYVLGTACVTSIAVGAALVLATRSLGPFRWARFHHLAQCLIPLAGCGVFLGLSMTTVTILRGEGVPLPFIDMLRAFLLVGAGLWCLWLSWKVTASYSAIGRHRLAATSGMSLAISFGTINWILLFWVW